MGRPYFSRIEVEGEYVTVGAGARLKQIVAEARKFNLGGFEFMEGIPGNLGGALRMNAGAMQGWTMEVVDSVRSIDLLGHVHEVRKEDMEIHYRNVPHFQNHIAVSAGSRAGRAARTRSTKAESLLGQALDLPARRAERRLHLQESRPDARGQADRRAWPEESFRRLGPCLRSARQFHRHVLQLISLIQSRARESRQIDLHTEVIVLGEEN